MTTIIDTADRKKKYKKVAYYPGCALEGAAAPYDKSTRAVGKALGLELVDVKDWNCCGAMEVKNVDPEIQTYLSSRVMSKAVNETAQNVVMAPCNGCYHNLKKAEYDIANKDKSKEVVEKISAKAGHKAYEAGEVETIHALDWIKFGYGEEELKEKIKVGLKGLRSRIITAACIRARAIFSRKKTKAGIASPRPSRIIWTICSPLPARKTSNFRLKPRAAAARILCQIPTCRPSSCSIFCKRRKRRGQRLSRRNARLAIAG